MNNDIKKVTPKQVQELLDEVSCLGIDNPSVDEFSYGLSLVLRTRLESGEVDEIRYSLLKKCLEDIKEKFDEYFLTFKIPDSAKIYSPGDFSFLYSVFARHIQPGFGFSILERGLQYFCDTGGGKSTVLRHLATAWTSLTPRLPCIIFAAKNDQFFFKLAREPHNAGRCLLLRCSKDTFYNAFASFSLRATDFLATKLQYWQACYNRWDSASIIAHIFKLFDQEKHLTGFIAPTVDYILGKLEQIKLPRGLFNPLLKASAYEAFLLMKEGHLGQTVMNCQTGINWEEVWKKGLVVVIETAHLSEAECHFFISCILADLREIKERNPSLPHLLTIIDEGGNLVNKRWDSGNRASPLASEITLLRGSGICLAIAYHTVSGINPPVRSNSAITMVGPLGNGADIFAAAQSEALTPEQREAIAHLKPYTAILKVAGVEYTDSYPVTWDPPVAYPDFPENERQQINQSLWATLPAIVPKDYRTIIRGQTPAAKTSAPAPSTALDNDYLAILHDLAKRPFLNVTERSASITLPSGTILNFKSMKDALDALNNKYNFCRPMAVQFTMRGRPSELWYLTQEGHQAIGSLFKPARGEHEHDFAKRLIQNILKQNMHIDSTLEMVLPGSSKPVDLGIICTQTGLKFALEIPISTFSTEPDQVEKNFAAGWDRVIEVCMTSADLKKLKAEFAKKNYPANPRVACCLPADLRSAKSLSDIFNKHCHIKTI